MKTLFSCLMLAFLSFKSQAQERVEGTIIKDYGPTFEVPQQDIKIDTTATLKVIFDVSSTSEDTSKPNKQLITAARFLNMHAHEGLPLHQLKVAITIHGAAWQDVLDHEAYKKIHGIDNPNYKLIQQLTDAGVDVILCGQTAGYRGLDKNNTHPNIQFALSAMTALIQYQNMGYRFIKF